MIALQRTLENKEMGVRKLGRGEEGGFKELSLTLRL